MGIILTLVLGCGESSGPSQTIHQVSILASETWTRAESPHIVQGQIHIGGGAILTIEAGATVVFKPRASLTFGVYGPGSLQANGTAADPITLRGMDTASGPWIGLVFRGRSASEMRFVNVNGCGYDLFADSVPPGCLMLGKPLTSDAPTLLIDHVTVSDGITAAILLNNESRFAAGSTTLSVTYMHGVIGSIPASEVSRFPFGGTFTGNDTNEIRLTIDTVRESMTWTDEVPWNVVGPVLIEGANQPVLTIPAGTTLRMTGALVVGKNAPGSLQIGSEGGATATLSAARTKWAGVDFSARAITSSIINAVFEDCGLYQEGRMGSACISIAGRWDDSSDIAPAPVFKNVTVRRATGAGIGVSYGGAFGAGSTNLTITGTSGSIPQYGDGVPLGFYQTGLGSVPPGQYTGNAADFIWTYETVIRKDETWHKRDVPYFIYGFVSIGDTLAHPTVTIEPGVTVVFGVASKLQVGPDAPGALRAIGTPTAPITFTGQSTTAGFWGAIDLGPYADTSSRFEHVINEYGGGPYPVPGSFYFSKDIGPVIRNSIIRASGLCGIILRNGTVWTTDFADPLLGNTFTNNPGGSICGP